MQNFCISCQNGIIYAGSWGYMVVMFHPIRPNSANIKQTEK